MPVALAIITVVVTYLFRKILSDYSNRDQLDQLNESNVDMTAFIAVFPLKKSGKKSDLDTPKVVKKATMTFCTKFKKPFSRSDSFYDAVYRVGS